MELKIKFSVILPILERKDIVKGFPMAIESISKYFKTRSGFSSSRWIISKSFKGLIMKLKKKYLFELIC